MARCDWCGKEFDLDEARSVFDDECGGIWSYDNFSSCLCGECAIEAIQSEETGVYYETCECCGKRFDYGEDCATFDEYVNGGGATLVSCWNGENGILCAQCAIDYVEEENEKYGNA